MTQGRLLLLVFLANACLLAGTTNGQLDDDQFQAGLLGHYADAAGHSFLRVDPRIALDGSTSSSDRRLAGPLAQAHWQGFLMSQANGEYRLAAQMAGELKIELAGKVVLAASSAEETWVESGLLDLPFDYHPLRIEYHTASAAARLVLYWSGPQFRWEPIPVKQFYHEPGDRPDSNFDRGKTLVRALRCAGCHVIPGEPPTLAAPSLEHLDGTLHRQWLIDRLQTRQATNSPAGSMRNMPHLGLGPADAEAIVAWLFDRSTPAIWQPPPPAPPGERSSTKKKANRRDEPAEAVDPVRQGEQLFLTTGCLACHALDGPAGSLLGGGNLAAIAAKRPRSFYEQWLAAPESINPDHHMPVFALSAAERGQLAEWLSRQGAPVSSETGRSKFAPDVLARGQALVAELRCQACHRLPGNAIKQEQPLRHPLTANARWDNACLAAPQPQKKQPGYGLPAEDQEAIRSFFETLPRETELATPSAVNAAQLMAESHCFACHARDAMSGLAPALTQLAARHEKLAPQIPAMTPPALDQVGDKLHRAALERAIRRQDKPHRDYLLVRMPQFHFSDAQRQSLVDYLIGMDRVPAAAIGDRPSARELDDLTLEAAGRRLVTPDGFGCTSCHQIGSVMPSKAPLNARGPTLSLLGERIRREWFDRFVSNPARVVPGMEMPSVRLAVRGLLDEDLQAQLAAVWDILNRPGFEPPAPDPLRVVRHTGMPGSSQRASAISDVVRSEDETFVKPLLIGLSNRHNILFDLETASLATWSIGDTAWQRTEGKTWYWEAAGNPILRTDLQRPELTWSADGLEFENPRLTGQFPTEFESLVHHPPRVSFRHRLFYSDAGRLPVGLMVEQSFEPAAASGTSGFRRTLTMTGSSPGSALRLAVLSSELMATARWSSGQRVVQVPRGDVRIELVSPAQAHWNADGSLFVPVGETSDRISIVLDYQTGIPVDRLPVEMTPAVSPPAVELHVVPGFQAIRLPISSDLMPTALAWRPNGELVVGSLKGRVWLARDRDGDGLEEEILPFSDELAAPYGLAATNEYVDVATKYAVLRLIDEDLDGQVDRTLTIASGWGHTADYHDWAVGLPRDDAGNYYVALPCQQDQRSPAAAHLRGTVLQLVPRTPTAADSRLYELHPLSAGHRFPMGIALRRDGAMFVTDNQGNYNPFNELNHVIPGRRYGFINALERQPGFDPPLTPPAVNIPHPWTRSVNGICFLETPQAMSGPGITPRFGPFEGHLIGCEYDTQRLVRFSLQRVGNDFQGAAYPFSYDVPPDGPSFLGPLACAIAPGGDIYVGGIRDSGWGGANNVGELVRLRPQLANLPCGIAEVRALPTGFEVSFLTPIDRAAGARTDSYSVTAYTRISTPAYGGPDEDRHNVRVRAVQVAADGRSASLELDELLAGYVYELHVKNLAGEGREFFPAESHYTMRSVPAAETGPGGQR